MLTTQLWSGPCYLPAEQCHTTTAWPRAVEDTDKLGLAFTRVFSETPSPLHWGSLALLCLATSRNNIQQAETKPETAVRGRTEGSQRQKQQTFLWVVMVQARKSLKLSHQRTRGKPFPSISLFVFFFCLLLPQHSFSLGPTSPIRDFYKLRTDSLELGIDVLQIPLEGFTVQLAALLHSFCNTGNTGRLL